MSLVFDPTVAGAAADQLTITSNSSTNGTATIALRGTKGTSVLFGNLGMLPVAPWAR